MMTIIALLVFLCPMNGMSNMRGALSVALSNSTLCASDASCVVMSFSEILFDKSIPLFIALIAPAIIYFKISKNGMFLAAQTKLTRYKQRSRFYTTFIRSQSREKMLAWIALFENHEITLRA